MSSDSHHNALSRLVEEKASVMTVAAAQLLNNRLNGCAAEALGAVATSFLVYKGFPGSRGGGNKRFKGGSCILFRWLSF